MPFRLSAVAVALVLLAAGCGGDGGPSRREAVASYIDKVNSIQADLVGPARSVSQATRRLAKPRSNPDRVAVAKQLRLAARRIDRLRVRTAAVDAPADAKRLRSLELERMRSQAALARELAALAEFGPAYQAALAHLGPPAKRLEAALTAKSPPAAKAAALDAYAGSVDATLRRLRALPQPPQVSASTYRSQITALTHVRGASTALARALRGQNAAAIPALLRRFEEAARSNQTLTAQRAQIAAVRAYNARVRGLDDLAIRIHRERARLQKKLE